MYPTKFFYRKAFNLKKLTLIALGLLTSVSLVACGSTQTNSTGVEDKKVVSEAVTEASDAVVDVATDAVSEAVDAATETLEESTETVEIANPITEHSDLASLVEAVGFDFEVPEAIGDEYTNVVYMDINGETAEALYKSADGKEINIRKVAKDILAAGLAEEAALEASEDVSVETAEAEASDAGEAATEESSVTEMITIGDAEVEVVSDDSLSSELAGVYTMFENTTEVDVDGVKVTLMGNGDTYCLATWTDGDYSYSVFFEDGDYDTYEGISSDELVDIVKSVH